MLCCVVFYCVALCVYCVMLCYIMLCYVKVCCALVCFGFGFSVLYCVRIVLRYVALRFFSCCVVFCFVFFNYVVR